MVLRYQREKAYHNKAFSEGTRSAVGGFYSITQRSKEYYERYLESRSDGKHVLEYGCGQGSHSMFLAHGGAQVTGIDISEVAIEQSKQSARNEQLDEETDFQVMNAESLEFDDDTFDLICGTAILHHLDLEKAFSEVSRTLRPGGSAIFFEPLGHNPFINLFRSLNLQFPLRPIITFSTKCLLLINHDYTPTLRTKLHKKPPNILLFYHK